MNNAQNSNTIERRESQNTTAEKNNAPVDASGTAEVFVTQAEVVGQVTDVIGSAESAEGSESAEDGEGFGEGEQSGKAKQGSGKGKQDDQQSTTQVKTAHLPPPTLMKKQIAQEIRKEIRKEEKKIMAAYLGFSDIAPDKLAEIVAKIRQLKDLLASLMDAAGDVLKSLYDKWVRA